jgi:4-hydroxy-3-methylbut-2-en-1-yl diphosphate reductase
VIIPAHGVPADVKAEAAERGLTVIDATCPLVTGAQSEARRLADRGDHVLLIGPPDQAATAGIASRAAGHVTVVGTAAATSALHIDDSRRISYLMQPGAQVEASAGIVSALRSRFPAAKGPRPDGFCYAPSDRAGTVQSVASSCDLMLVLGDPQSADSRQVCGQARDAGARVLQVADVSDITPAALAAAEAIGVAEATSAPVALAAQVIAALSGLGRLNVVRRQLRTSVPG